MAAYRSSSSVSPNSRVCASESRAVASASPRAVANFDTGARTRVQISATTLSRSGHGAVERKRSRPNLRREPSTAATWPWGLERTMSKASSGLTNGWFLSSRRRVSILAAGQSERLAMVRLRTRLPSRQPSRRRMAGAVLRLGTVSTYMATTGQVNARIKDQYPIYLGTKNAPKHPVSPWKSIA